MNGLTFLKKELKEIFRTYKLYVVPAVFLLFGFISPLITKMMPDIINNIGDGIVIQLPEMTWIDSFQQLFKNLNQMGLLALVVVTMGTIADEKAHNVTLLILTKPISRTAYVMAKFAANAILVLVSLALAFLAAWYYTTILFTGAQFTEALAATALYGVYALVILALTIFCSAISKSLVAAGGLSIVGMLVMSLLPSLHKSLATWSPAALLSLQNHILLGTADTSQVWATTALSLGVAAAFLAAGALIFSRQEL